jgi:pimeloyl-ACP methyl ester carboxylesterase
MKIPRLLRRIALFVGTAVAVTMLSAATYEAAMRRHVMRVFKIPGRLVNVGGGRRIQIDCRGTGSPTVVLESGLDTYGSLSWAAVHDSIAKTTRVCAYSRAGIMWSDPATGPFSSEGVARDLHTALIGSGEAAPWVVVGHSLGGPYAVTFTALYGAEVVGLVFVDGTHPDQFARFREIAGKSIQPTEDAVALGDALAWTGLVRLLPVGTVPSAWPSDVGRVTPGFLPTSIHPLRREIRGLSATLASARTAKTLGDRPLVVLTAGRVQTSDALRSMGLTDAQGVQLVEASRKLHDDQATWSSRGRHEFVADASHYIQFDRPDVVIRAVREVTDAARHTGDARTGAAR